MDKLIKTLPAILKAAGAAEEVTEAACIAAWKYAVGDGLRVHAVAVQLRQHTLIVVVADNIWKRQLEQMRGQLLFRLNSVLGQALVKSVELRVDPKALAKLCASQAGAGARKRLDYQIPAELLSAASGIADVALRRAFLGAAASCVKRLENQKSET